MKSLESVSAKEKSSLLPQHEQKGSSAIQCKGYEAKTAYPKTLVQRKENNTGLRNDIKAGVESLSGIAMDDVNVHYNSDKPAGLNAHAYAQGTNIYIAPGNEKHVAHEAWHVVQQKQGRVKATMQMKGVNINNDGQLEKEADVSGAKALKKGRELLTSNPTSFGSSETNLPAAHAAKEADTTTQKKSSNLMTTEVVQGDIGFEFETATIETKKSNTGTLPGGGFASAIAASTVWNAPTSKRVKKGASLLKKADIDVQADDRGASSDLEVVTTHFPLDTGGRTRLDDAMNDLTTLVNAHGVLAATSGNIVPAEALDGTAAFSTTMKAGMISGDWTTATTAPQITFGTRIENVADIVRDLHGDPGESVHEKALRDPGRLRMRKAKPLNNAEPTNLNAGNEANTLVSGHTLAHNAILSYHGKNGTAPVGRELEGLLTIIFTYCEGVNHKMTFLKNHTPLMAKTNLATIFTTLPMPVQTYYSQKDNTGKTNLEKLVEEAPNYDAKMDLPLFGGEYADDMNKAPGQAQWYHRLTLSSWLRGIVLRDRTYGEAFGQFIIDNYGGSKMRPGKDQLTDKAFPKKPRGREIEGYGALGERMDKDVTVPTTPLPVFELRSASKPITYAAAHQWALDLFDYIRSLNANPNGGHTLMH